MTGISAIPAGSRSEVTQLCGARKGHLCSVVQQASSPLRGLPSAAEADGAFVLVIPARPAQPFPVPGADFAPVPQILDSLEQAACQAGYPRAGLPDDGHDGRDTA